MDDRCLTQIGSFWPDLVDPLRDILPQGCLLVRLLDEWFLEDQSYTDRRIRSIELLPDGASVDEVCENTSHLATTDGWRIAEREDATAKDVLERGRETLEVGPAQAPLAGAKVDVVRLDFEQPWPADAQLPVDCSETFIEICTRVLKLDEFPTYLAKEVRLDLGDLARSHYTRERVEFMTDEDVRPRVRNAGYQPKPEAPATFEATSRTTAYDLVAQVTFGEEHLRLELERKRIGS